MTKTIEKAANEYAANWEAKHNIHNPELYDLIVDAYKESAERIMSLSLAQRLTAEEKEMVRKEYANTYPLDPDCGVANILIQGVLERIFGKDFFKEGE